MYWLGGAIDVKDSIIEKYASHVDIAKTILRQLEVPSGEFTYGKDILSEGNEDNVFFAFNNGFGFIADSLELIFDNNTNKYLKIEGLSDSLQLDKGKAYLQMLSNDFQKRGH